MKKYRIKHEMKNNGRTVYVIQEKGIFFYRDVYKGGKRVAFNKYKNAMKFLNEYRKIEHGNEW